MTKSDVMKEFLKKTVIPVVVALFLFTLIPIGFGISGTVGVVALNLVLGGLIGGVILIWKLAVALWYLPLTIYRLVT